MRVGDLKRLLEPLDNDREVRVGSPFECATPKAIGIWTDDSDVYVLGSSFGDDEAVCLGRDGVMDPDSPLDSGIAPYVHALQSGGIETYESCQGGAGHCFPEPTVRFHGGQAEGFRALAIAAENGLPVLALRRFWSVVDGEPTGPSWEMTFRRDTDHDHRRNSAAVNIP